MLPECCVYGKIREHMNAIFVFVMDGCGACEQYLPRFQRLASAAGAPGRVYDIAKDQHGAAFADKLGVKATPTTVVMRDGRIKSHVGAISNAEISKLLMEVRPAAKP